MEDSTLDATPENHEGSALDVEKGSDSGENTAPILPPKKRGKVGAIFSSLGDTYREVFLAIRSQDRPTRRMAWLFVGCHVGVILVLTVGSKMYVEIARERIEERRLAEQEKAQLGKFLEDHANEAKKQGSLLELGRFNIEMTTSQELPETRAVLFKEAEINLVAECDSKATCEFLEKNMTQVRDQIVELVSSVDRDELLTREGKKRLRRAIQDKLNLWLHEGRVEEIYISRLVMG